MVRCPPDWSFLSGGRADEGEDELEPTTCFVASVREIAVVDTGDSKHPHYIQSDAYGKSDPTEPSPQHQEAPKMNRPERELFNEIDRMEWVTACVHLLNSFCEVRFFCWALA